MQTELNLFELFRSIRDPHTQPAIRFVLAGLLRKRLESLSTDESILKDIGIREAKVRGPRKEKHGKGSK